MPTSAIAIKERDAWGNNFLHYSVKHNLQTVCT